MGEGGAPSIPAGLRVDRAPWQGPRVPLGVPARGFARRPQEITVAILAQGTHWAVAGTQASLLTIWVLTIHRCCFSAADLTTGQTMTDWSAGRLDP